MSEETDNLQIDGKIEHMFIDDDERFYKDDLTEKDKEFLHELVHRSNYLNIDFETDSDDIDFEIKQIPQNSDDDVMYVKYVLPPPNSRIQLPLHPCERLKQKIKNIRKKKERYRKLKKENAISFLNKERAKDLLKEHKKQQNNEQINNEIINISDAETLGYASDISDAETIQYAKSRLNNQYRLKAKKKAIKTLRKKRTEPDLKITKVVRPTSPEMGK